MNIGKACGIFSDIENENYTAEEKGEAILQVVQMNTHMGITKKSMLKVIWWLLNLVFDLECMIEENAPEDTKPPQ